MPVYNHRIKYPKRKQIKQANFCEANDILLKGIQQVWLLPFVKEEHRLFSNK